MNDFIRRRVLVASCDLCMFVCELSRKCCFISLKSIRFFIVGGGGEGEWEEGERGRAIRPELFILARWLNKISV